MLEGGATNAADPVLMQLLDMEGDAEPLTTEENTPELGSKPEADEVVAPVNPTPDVIKAAQDDLLQLDVLVCGKCHNVYHFMEGFMEHKNSNECDGETQVFKSNTEESKPQVWAFMLWKAAHSKEGPEGQTSPDWASNSWDLYQRWCKLGDPVRKTWLEAGKTLQNLTQLANAKLDLAKKGANKPVLTPAQLQQQQQTLLELQKELEDDETEIMSTLGLVRGSKNKKDADAEDDGQNKQLKINRVVRRSLKPKLDDDDDTENEEYIVEKIVAKRVNPKTKQPEYLLKWEGFPSDQNTWEPIQNMSTCTKLVQEFEKNLARQKARKAMEATKVSKNVIRLEDLVTTSSSGRPVRNSAKKALDQVKEWVSMGSKRRLESEEDSEADDPVPIRTPVKKQATKASSDLSSIFKSKVLSSSSGKTPVLVANSKGVVRVDPKQVPNLSSGVYILSSQSGLIKVDDPTAAKLTEAMKNDVKKTVVDTPNPKVMINETEIRKIPKAQAQQKGAVKRDSTLSPSVKIIQRSSMNNLPLPLRLTSPKLSSLGPGRLLSQIGTKSGTRVLQTVVSSPATKQQLKSYKTPILNPKVTIKTPQSAASKLALRLNQLGQRNVIRERIATEKVSDDDFDGGLPDEFPKEDEPIAPPSPSRPLTLCPLTGEVLGRAEGERTPPPHGMDEGESILPDLEDDGMMRVEMSPGGTIRQVLTRTMIHAAQPKRQLSLLHRTPKGKALQQVVVQPQEPELISIQGEDGVIYQMTAEQQQMLLQNGTFTVDGRIIQDDTTADSEHTEIVFQNGQIIQRTVVGSGEGMDGEAAEDGEGIILHNESSNDEGQVYAVEGGDGVLTLDSAVQEAVGEAEAAGSGGDDSQQMVAQIVQAEPPTPGGGPRKVVLLLPDGSLIHTEMDEEQYQALEFEK